MKKMFMLASLLALMSTTALAGNHVAVKIHGLGLNLSPATGATLGQLDATVDTAAITKKDGSPLDQSAGVCSRFTSVNTFANLNSHASASASNVPVPVGGAVSNVSGPSLAAAAADETANGGASIVAAAAMTADPAAVIDAYCGNVTLPSAPSGAQIRPNGQ